MKKTTVLLLLMMSVSLPLTHAALADSMALKTFAAIQLSTGINGKIDPQGAYMTLLGLADQGYPMAMNAVGRMCFDGTGCAVDVAAGLDWLNRAGEAGYYASWHNLGTIYKYGRSGVPQDFELSFYYFDKIAQAPNSTMYLGMYDAGFMLYKGLGCTQDYGKAFAYFKKASEKGFVPAMYMLALCYRNGYGVMRNMGEAGYWLSQASKEGYAPAVDEYYAQGPENTPVRMMVKSSKVKSAPQQYTRIANIKNVEVSKLDGEYEGVLVTYDWSGKLVIKETLLSLSIQTEKDVITAQWREQGADTVQVKGVWSEESLTFIDAYQSRKGHYDVKGKALWTFTKAQLQVLQDDSSSYLAGNLQMYSPETMEPHQPVYLNLRKVSSPVIKQETPFSVYPNPFDQGLNISFYQQQLTEVKVALYQTSGQRVYFESLGMLPQGQQDITLTLPLKTGVYVLKLLAGDKVYQTVVIKK